LFFEKPRLLAPPYLTEEIPERVDFKGNALKAIDVEASRQAIRRLKKKDVQSVAVCCFLFSFLNPDHELKIKELFAEEFPEARLSLSYEVSRRFASSTVWHDGDQRLHSAGHGELPWATGKPHAREWA
jgi:N-methylhydantoinase A